MAAAATTAGKTFVHIIEDTPAGPRARFTIPVGKDAAAAVARAGQRVAHLAANTTNPVRFETVVCAR